jgi:hypothetical protein
MWFQFSLLLGVAAVLALLFLCRKETFESPEQKRQVISGWFAANPERSYVNFRKDTGGDILDYVSGR